jgi:hypothetical protein
MKTFMVPMLEKEMMGKLLSDISQASFKAKLLEEKKEARTQLASQKSTFRFLCCKL